MSAIWPNGSWIAGFLVGGLVAVSVRMVLDDWRYRQARRVFDQKIGTEMPSVLLAQPSPQWIQAPYPYCRKTGCNAFRIVDHDGHGALTVTTPATPDHEHDWSDQ